MKYIAIYDELVNLENIVRIQFESDKTTGIVNCYGADRCHQYVIKDIEYFKSLKKLIRSKCGITDIDEPGTDVDVPSQGPTGSGDTTDSCFPPVTGAGVTLA